MKQFLEINELKTTEWIRRGKEKKQQPRAMYDAYMDTLYVYFVPIKKKERILTFYIDRFAAFLFRASDNEVLGICFEALQKSFFPAFINKQWKLSDSNIKLEGIHDLHFCMNVIEEKKPAPHYLALKPIDENFEFEPVYA